VSLKERYNNIVENTNEHLAINRAVRAQMYGSSQKETLKDTPIPVISIESIDQSHKQK
jgi:hypothetical protein